MSGFRITPWNFDPGDKVELYWLGSPVLNSEQQWDIRVLFRRQDGSFSDERLPIGYLPILRTGCKYMDGTAISEASGSGGILIFPGDVDFSKNSGLDIPKELYPFYNNTFYRNQLLCSFKISSINYYIPYMEIVRKILTPYRLLANRILETSGLDFFIESYNINNKNLEITLTPDFPKILLRDDAISYFTWLRFYEKGYNAWCSVYRNIYIEAIRRYGDPRKGFSYGIPVVTDPPVIPGEIWRYRGLKYNDIFLILELIERKRLVHPFSEIKYKSPNLIQPVFEDVPDGNNKNGSVSDGFPEIFPDETGEDANRWEKTVKVTSGHLGASFKRAPIVIKIRDRDNKYKARKTSQEGPSNVSPELIGTVRDWTRGGQIRSIEFLSFDRLADKTFPGLEDFLDVIDYIRKKHKNWEISITFINLYSKKRISSDGRICTVVRIDGSDIGTCYLVEINRINGESASTLVFQFRFEINDYSNVIIDNLNMLADKYFHWNTAFLNRQEGLKYKFVKHVKGQSIEDWGRRIEEIIINYFSII